ncbi:hypothetical protein [Mycobacterium branderi]|uniref:SMI1/KNR4 family protein n=1 Tax=Mycobacterium branderi TaxID=43348 RepID=A0AA91LVB6_9MYCO|nr:hypothetical protein [Mycobacterium branderi]ORA35538.1 hypothetical protein BST20_18025 [Mycobacterium branderi]
MRGVVIQPALTDAEIRRTEDRFGFEFADDHRALLSAGLPTGEHWPDWRGGNADDLRKALSWPVTGVLFDVENNAFWDCRWGERPADNAGAVKLAAAALADAPQMVPVYSHRYLPAGRETFGHPVLSIHQTDVICYGTDLVDYVFQEFGVGPGIERSDPRWRPRPTVAFWSDLLE